MRASAAIAGVIVLWLTSNPLSAGEPEGLTALQRPDPATVTVPALDKGSGGDFFYFHKAGVSYEVAFADLDECRMYSLQARLTVLPPKFVPLGAAAVKSEGTVPTAQLFMTYGVVGYLVAEPFIAAAEDDNAEAANRRCMAYKGYRRYGTSRLTWHKIKAGTDAEKFARLALIASGSQPAAGDIGP